MTLITVYVRKPPESTRECEMRTLSHVIPLAIPAHRLIDSGYAIDGSQCVRVVIADREKSFPEQLRNEEIEIVEFLTGAGYQVEFA